jgi:hypothetical protein
MRIELNDVINQADWAVKYRWDLRFFAVPAALGISFNPTLLNLRCESTEIPKSTGNTFSVTIRGLEDNVNPGLWKTAGKIKLVFVESVDNEILNWIQSWREAIWNPGIGNGLTKADLLVGVTLTRLGRKEEPVRYYTMAKTLLADYDPGGDLEEDDKGGVIKPNVTLVYPNFVETGYPKEAIPLAPEPSTAI